MSVQHWLRKLSRRFTGKTIELVAHDRFTLGFRICNLTTSELAMLEWSDAQRRALYAGLMTRNPRGYDGWHPGKEDLVPVTLRRWEWRMIERLCDDLMRTAPEAWHVRMVERIRTARSPKTEPADHP